MLTSISRKPFPWLRQERSLCQFVWNCYVQTFGEGVRGKELTPFCAALGPSPSGAGQGPLLVEPFQPGGTHTRTQTHTHTHKHTHTYIHTNSAD